MSAATTGAQNNLNTEPKAGAFLASSIPIAPQGTFTAYSKPQPAVLSFFAVWGQQWWRGYLVGCLETASRAVTCVHKLPHKLPPLYNLLHWLPHKAASQVASEFALCPVAQECTAQVGAAAAVPQLWVHSPGQRRHVHDTERCQSCAAAAARHARFWSVSQTAGYVYLSPASAPLFNHAFVLYLLICSLICSFTHSPVHSFVHACMHASSYTCIRLLVSFPGYPMHSMHLVHTVLCRSMHEVAVGQLAYQQRVLKMSQVWPHTNSCQFCFSVQQAVKLQYLHTCKVP